MSNYFLYFTWEGSIIYNFLNQINHHVFYNQRLMVRNARVARTRKRDKCGRSMGSIVQFVDFPFVRAWMMWHYQCT